MTIGAGFEDRLLEDGEVHEFIRRAFDVPSMNSQRVIVILPDGTRTAPIPLMFRELNQALGNRVAALDFLIALGTHQPMSEEAINAHLGITSEERKTTYRRSQIVNHRWDDPNTFTTLGRISAEEMGELTGGILKDPVDVRLNKMVLDYGLIVICGPTFPHEVVGFSGGNKYFFPGIGGSEVINFSHWLGALITSYETIGSKYTPVRRVIDRAASFITKPKLCISMVVKSGGLGGLFIGSPEEAYSEAADLSARLHIRWVERPFQRILSVMPGMYADLWTAAKGMYKLEPAVADGGEVIIYAPHLNEVSYTHGSYLDEIGYHVKDYFLKQWERFKDYPGGVLAHSTHLKGVGEYDADTGIEKPRINVTLATKIPEDRCHRLNLGYLDPDSIDLRDWEGREDQGVLFVPRAGEMLYRVTSVQRT
jgi:nickel-dependent lactate racemase